MKLFVANDASPQFIIEHPRQRVLFKEFVHSKFHIEIVSVVIGRKCDCHDRSSGDGECCCDSIRFCRYTEGYISSILIVVAGIVIVVMVDNVQGEKQRCMAVGM